jgi:hypothetical protein
MLVNKKIKCTVPEKLYYKVIVSEHKSIKITQVRQYCALLVTFLVSKIGLSLINEAS